MSELIRVPQIIGKLAAGGVESVVFNYYRNIDRTKIQFDFIIHEDSLVGFPGELIEMGANVYKIPSYKHIFKYIRSLRKILKENNYRIIHSHMNTMSVFSLFAAWSCGIKTRVCHNHSTANKSEGARAIAKYILRPFNKIFATDYFACGDYSAEWMFGKSNVEKGRVTVVNNAIDLDEFSTKPDIRASVRKHFNMEGKFVLGHVGRFEHQKNHSFLIEIFEAVHNKEPESVLFLAGRGGLEQEIKEKVKAKGLSDSVIFYGITGYTSAFYQALDVFVLPSFFEGFPVVGLEVQAVGCPIVSADTVTDKMKIADVEFISLDRPPEEWADIILSKRNSLRTENGSLLKKAGYDIKEKAKIIENFYLNKMRTY